MRNLLIEEFPILDKYLSENKVKSNYKLPNKNNFYINLDKKDIPIYDQSKHFYEQTPECLAFYEEEEKKIKEGLTIDGHFIHPWLYFSR